MLSEITDATVNKKQRDHLLSKLWKDIVLAKKITEEKNLLHFLVILFVLLNAFGILDSTLIDVDEGVFALQSQWLATMGAYGKPFNFQTPPLYQIIIALLFKLFQINAIVLPLLSSLASIVTIYLVFYLARVFCSKRESLYCVIFFIVTEYFLFFSRSGLSDATFLAFFVAAILFFAKGLRSNLSNHFLLAGLFTTLALYTKYSAFTLPVIFLIIGVLHRNTINKKWFILSIIIPALLYLPYIYLFIKIVRISTIGTRHVPLLGINHLKFLCYIFLYAPIPFILTIIYIFSKAKKIKGLETYFFIAMTAFFFIVGFYYPFFRLAYPLIPLLSISAAKFITKTGKFKNYIVVACVFISLLLGSNTFRYNSDIPKKLAEQVEKYAETEKIDYIFAVVPPNIIFYIRGAIVIPSNHHWLRIGKKIPVFLKGKKIIYPDNNELLDEEKILLIHATTIDSVKQENIELYNRGSLLTSIEFVDAPIYYKDVYNPFRNRKQIYEVYLFENEKLSNQIDNLWKLGFDPRITVIHRIYN